MPELLKILVVDDDIKRHVNFLRRLADHTVVSAGSYKEAIAALETGSPYDVIFLDHDLGTRKSGYDVARYLIEEMSEDLWPEQVIVHSLNIIGGPRIVRLLQDAGIPVRWEMYRPG
jgi:CheY-like chemotaxis protein